MRKDLKDIDVDECEWYEEATRSKVGWRVLYKLGLESYQEAETAQA